MRDEIIEILEMISPGISVENNFDIEIPSEEKIEENFENIESIMEMIVKLQ